MKENVIVTFGEIMGRLDLPRSVKLIQGLPGPVGYLFAGAEANVAASLSYLGMSARFVTALPDSAVGDACVHFLRGVGIDTRFIVRSTHRLGIYYVETGANQRPSKVIYDRAKSAISEASFEAFDWRAILDGASWLHVSGITPALSRLAAENTLAIARLAKEQRIPFSCDLNFRKKLWQWDERLEARQLARKVMPEILDCVDVLIGNEEDALDVLDIQAQKSDVTAGKIVHDSYVEVAEKILERFPNVKSVAITLRESLSASHNNWGAMLYDKASKQAFFAPLDENREYAPYPIFNIVDRIGGGDSFAAGLIYALNSQEYKDPQKAIRFAVAASCLCHSIQGDFNYSTKEEVEQLMRGNVSGRVQR